VASLLNPDQSAIARLSFAGRSSIKRACNQASTPARKQKQYFTHWLE